MHRLEERQDAADGAGLDDDLFELEADTRGFPFKRLAAAIVVLVAIGGGAYWWYTSQPGSSAPTYTSVPVARGDVSVGASATGPLATVTNVPVSFKTSGQVTQILVR